MTRILRIDSSPRGADSVSRRIADRAVARLGGEVTARDLAAAPPPLLTAEMVESYFTPPAERTDAQRAAIAPSDAVVAELMAADVIVVSAPIWNFGVPASLKAWADLAARVGVTFRYGPDGPVGLLEGKRAVIAVASGGTVAGSDADWATPWLRHFLGFLGIADVTVIAADALNRDDGTRTERAYAEAGGLPLAA